MNRGGFSSFKLRRSNDRAVQPFLLFQKGGPLSAVPMILAGGATLMATAGIFFFKEPPTIARLLGVALALVGLMLLRSQ